ncbi:MAG: prephenate dehydrogenase [Deltaproteobacteria bacterium]
MKRYGKIAIVGVGLLGGSLGLCLRRRRIARRVVGHFRDPQKIRPALVRGAIDEGTTDLREAVRGADIVVLATPVGDIEKKLALLRRIAGSNALITDTGSTKTSIVRAAVGLNFVGAHPLAGSEQSGIQAARPDLFADSLCILTPRKKDASWLKAAAFWKRVGCRVVTMTARRHDFILSRTSHLPHLAAFTLMACVPPETLRFAAGGLKDTTRIALSPPQLWTDIFFANRREVLNALASYERALGHLRHALLHGRRPQVLSRLAAAQRKRRAAR